MLIYLARRRLGMTPEEWLALPWWQTRVYIEGYQAEGILKDPDEDDEDDEIDLIEDDPVALGFNVTRV